MSLDITEGSMSVPSGEPQTDASRERSQVLVLPFACWFFNLQDFIYVYACNVYINIHTNLSLYIYKHTHLDAYVHTRVHTHIYIHVSTSS